MDIDQIADLRFKAFREWYGPLRRVHAETGSSDVQDLINFTRQYAIIGEPQEDNEGGLGVMTLEDKNCYERSFAIVPLVGDDFSRSISTSWDAYLRGFSEALVTAEYLPFHRILSLAHGEGLSWVMRGTVLAHELFHVKTIADPSIVESGEGYARNEVDAHAFQLDLLARVGGRVYARALEEEMTYVRAEVKGEIGDPTAVYPHLRNYSGELDAAFETPKSEVDAELRTFLLRVHAHFALFEESSSDTSEAMKRKWLFFRQNIGPKHLRLT